jgi:hypothetical protein
MRILTLTAIGIVGGAAMLALSMGPASAFTLAGPSLQQPVASAQIDKVWWRRWGYRRGWGPGWGGHCWRGYYGHLHCN